MKELGRRGLLWPTQRYQTQVPARPFRRTHAGDIHLVGAREACKYNDMAWIGYGR